MFLSEGRPGQVLRIEVRGRTGNEKSFSQAIRSALSSIPGVQAGSGRQVGMGGMFRILGGSVKTHVQPDWDVIDRDSPNYFDSKLNKVVKPFLKFFEGLEAELVCAAALWTGDPTGGKLNLRSSGEHTHCFTDDLIRGEGGHYHGDEDHIKADVHYIGYFNLAEKIYLVSDADNFAKEVAEMRLNSLKHTGSL